MAKSASSNYKPETNFTLQIPKLQLEIQCMICQILNILSSPTHAFSNWNKSYSTMYAMNNTGIRYLPTKMKLNFRRPQIEFISDKNHAFVTTQYGHIGSWTLVTKPKSDLRSCSNPKLIYQNQMEGWGRGKGSSWFQFRHPTYERKHIHQTLSKIKTHKEERLVRSRTVCALCYTGVLYRPLNAARWGRYTQAMTKQTLAM